MTRWLHITFLIFSYCSLTQILRPVNIFFLLTLFLLVQGYLHVFIFYEANNKYLMCTYVVFVDK